MYSFPVCLPISVQYMSLCNIDKYLGFCFLCSRKEEIYVMNGRSNLLHIWLFDYIVIFYISLFQNHTLLASINFVIPLGILHVRLKMMKNQYSTLYTWFSDAQ